VFKKINCLLQVFAIVVGIIYFGQELNQTSIININGVLFWTIMNQTFTTYNTVLNVSVLLHYHNQVTNENNNLKRIPNITTRCIPKCLLLISLSIQKCALAFNSFFKGFLRGNSDHETRASQRALPDRRLLYGSAVGRPAPVLFDPCHLHVHLLLHGDAG
jgi:hypothetical protein